MERAKPGSKPNALAKKALRPTQIVPLAPPRPDDPRFMALWEGLTSSFALEYFSEADVPLMGQYCDLVIHVQDLQAQLVGEPAVLEGRWGRKANPLNEVLSRRRRDLLALATKLRVGPVSRSVPRDTSTLNKREEAPAPRGGNGKVLPLIPIAGR